MDNENSVSAAPTAQTPENNADAKGGENVGINQAVNRMLKMEQAKEAQANAPEAGSVPQAEQAPTEQPAPETAVAPESDAVAAEPEVKPEGEPEATPEEVLSHEETLDPKFQEILKKRNEAVEKRVSREVAKRKQLEAQLNELTLKVQAQTAAPKDTPAALVPLPVGAPPLANIEDSSGLVALQQQAKEAIRWAEQQLDDFDGNPIQLGDKNLGQKELKNIIRTARKTLEDDIPARAQFLQQREVVNKTAHEEFKFLTDKSSPDYVAAQSAYQAMPWLKNLPNAEWIIGVQIEGLKALQAKKAAAEKAKAKAPVKTAPPPASQASVSSNGGTTRVAAGTRSQQEISAIRSGLSRKGNVSANDAIAALTKIEQLRATR